MLHALAKLSPRALDKTVIPPRTTRAAEPAPLDVLEERFFAAWQA